jgi:hypothetical protein
MTYTVESIGGSPVPARSLADSRRVARELQRQGRSSLIVGWTNGQARVIALFGVLAGGARTELEATAYGERFANLYAETLPRLADTVPAIAVPLPVAV